MNTIPKLVNKLLFFYITIIISIIWLFIL